MPIRRRQVRFAAEKLLLSHQVAEAPVPVVQLAEGLGAEICYEPAEDSLSGFLLRIPVQRRAVIGVNSNHHENRQRFTIAHEVGHLLLHEGDRLHVDRVDLGLRVKRRDERSSEGTDDEEREANLFAAELLMPAVMLERDLESIGSCDLLDEDVLVPLARRYKVSTQALAFRLTYLGYVRS
jgi:Zn-dependent peptidase ImmA (M78 family)